jgi:hypothetical protein
MPKYATPAVFAALVLVGGCAAVVTDKEDMLAAAGFAYRPADTPQRIAALHALPPHKFAHQVRNGMVVWIYADPTICNCLYAGNEAAYDAYRHEVFERHIADEQAMAASMNEDAAASISMDWGPWAGPWGPYRF